MSNIVVVGSLNTDVAIAVDHLPGRGETVVTIGPTSIGFGGKGGNQASAAASLGAQVCMIGRVGDDDAGSTLRDDLLRQGIDVSCVLSTPGARTGSATIAVDRNGDNIILVDIGANALLRPADIGSPLVAAAAAVLVQLEIPMATALAALRSTSGLAVLNPAPATALPDEVFAETDVLVPNCNELALLTGAPPPRDPDETLALVEKLPSDLNVVVTLGADGALVVDRRGHRVTHLWPPPVDTVDTTGAGDIFCATLVVALTEGMTLVEAATQAVAAASLSTTAFGARGYIPTRAQAEPLRTSVHARAMSNYSERNNDALA